MRASRIANGFLVLGAVVAATAGGCAREGASGGYSAPPPQGYPYASGPQGSPPNGPNRPPVQATNQGQPDLGQTCVDAINRRRATLRLPPLQRWVDGESCAAREAQTDGPKHAPHGSFGMCREMAQNVCPDWPGPAGAVTEPCVQSMWEEGPGADFSKHGHYLNMSSSTYQWVACGYFTLPNGSVWLVQNFK